jgi:hypothetical protein
MFSATYDHRYWKTRDPVRSPIDKPIIARLVLGWVTTGESLVLYVFVSFSLISVHLITSRSPRIRSSPTWFDNMNLDFKTPGPQFL